MANWCKNEIYFLGSSERINAVIRGWKAQAGGAEADRLRLGFSAADGSGVIEQNFLKPVFGTDHMTGSTEWCPPWDWLAAVTAEHHLAALLAYFDESDGSTTHELFVCGESYPLFTVRTGCGGEIELSVGGDTGKKHLLPNPLPSAEFEAARTGATADEVLRRRDETAVDAIRLVNESLAKDRAEPPLALTAANKRRVSVILHQHGFRWPERVYERLHQFDREAAVQPG